MSEAWFQTDIFSGRVISSTIWTVVISFFWLLLISFLSLFLQSPLHPITSLITTVNQLLSPSSLFFLLVFTFITVWGCVKHSQNYSMNPTVFHSWSKLMSASTQPSTATSLAQFLLQSTVTAWCCVKLVWVEYSSLVNICEDSWCVNHHQLFLLGCGAAAGLCVGLRYHFYSDNWVAFPVIYKDTTTQIKQGVRPLLLASVRQSLHILKYYYVLYFIISLAISSSFPMAPLSIYLSFTLFIAALSVTTLVIIINSTRLKIFSIFLTAPLPPTSLELLISSLSPASSLLHLLSLQSLSRLTATSAAARSTIFSLSQPGGHPHSWKTVSQSCLASLDSISSSISSLSSSPLPPSSPPAKPLIQQITSPTMRRLAPHTGAKTEDLALAPTSSPATQVVSSIVSLLETLKKQPIIALLFKVHPEAKLRSVFCQSQGAIWSVDILSHLVAFSITEDRFGVVQKELPNILNSLLTLEQRMVGPRRTGLEIDGDVSLKQELKGSIKAGLYRIAIQFGEHMQAVPLNREQSIKMMNYQKLLEA